MSAVAEKRLALVGVGRIAAAYLDVLPEMPEIVLASAVEPNAEHAKAAIDRGARVFASVDEMLREGTAPDAAVICTPPVLHGDVALPLLQAGTDCLIEKPLATVPADAHRIATQAERFGRTLVTAAKFRVTEALLEAARLIGSGRIGRLTYVENTFTGKLDAKAGWHGDPQVSGGGVWMDNGPHSIDVVETLAGPIERIRMVEECREQETAVEDEVVVEAEHPGGVLSRITLSWNRQITAPIARCVGTDAELLVGWAQTVIRDGDRDEVVAGGYDKRGAFLGLLQRFFAERTKGSCIEDHGAQSVDWLHAAYRSCRSSRWEIC